MKKFFYMAVAVIAALSSCTNDNDAILGEGGKQNEGVTTFTATIEGDAATRTTYNTTSKKAEWIETTDKINVGGAEYTAQSTGATTTFDGTGATKDGSVYKAYYPSSMVSGSTITLPASYAYDGNFNMPMYAESETTSLEFKNLCGVLAITVPSTEMTSVKSITVTSDKQLNGEIESITSGGVLTFKSATLTDANKKVSLTFSTAKTISGSETFYIPVPAGTHNPLRIVISNDTKAKVKLTSGSVSVDRSKIYSIDFNHNDNNLLTSVFSVSATKKVSFTNGNLRAKYTGSHYEWEFANTQYEYKGSTGTAQGNTTIDDQGTYKYVDLFGWSTNATNNNWGIHTKTSAANGYTTGNFQDWGDNFPGKYYSTLSYAEWTYLLNTRTVNGGTGEGKAYQRTTLTLSDGSTTVYGMLIAPDGYPNSLPSTTTTWNEWETYLKPAGVVFLPAAGHRYGSGVSNAGSYGNYWSSTFGATDKAYYMDFFSYGVSTGSREYRNYGYSVRLVSVVSE